MEDIVVHYNSDRPAQLPAHTNAQGDDIHISTAQKKHLPHQPWHVVQQKQHRLTPTFQIVQGINVVDDNGLEREADIMGAKANKQPGK